MSPGGILSLRKLLRRKGLKVGRSTTPGDVKRTALQLGISEVVGEFMRLYEEHRFGGRQLLPEDRQRYEKLIKEVKKRI